MYKDLEKIIIDNKLNNEFKPNKIKVLFVDRFKIDLVIKFNLIAKIFNEKYNYEPIVFHEYRKESHLLKIYKYFNLNNLVKINLFKNYLIYLIPSFFISLKVILKIFFNGYKWFIDDFEIKKIKVGDLIYDTYTRYNHNFAKRNYLSLFFFKTVFLAVIKILFFVDIVKKYNFKTCVVGQHSYLNSSTILFRICSVIKKDTNFFIATGPEFIHYKFPKNNLFTLPFSIRPEYLKTINFKNKKIIKDYKIHLDKKNKGKIIQNHDNMNANYKKKMFSKTQILKKIQVKKNENYKSIALYAAHVFADGPHGSGKMLFDDYYDQLLFTIDKMKQNKDVLYILKSHPSSFLLNEEGFLENFYKENYIGKHKNIKLCPKNIKTNAILSIVDTVITCSGTAGLEIAALYGKRPLLAGSSHYSHLGFTQDCKTRSEYYKYLANPKLLPKLSNLDKINANKTIYLIEKVFKAKNIGNFFPKNIRVYKYKKISLISDKKYMKQLIINSKKIKIKEDIYFKYIKKVIKFGMSRKLSKLYKPNLDNL
jgi:hypothetical protein